MGYIEYFDGCIQCKASLKELVEFAYIDEELLCRNDQKIIKYTGMDGVQAQDFVYKKLLGDRKKWDERRSQEYLYTIVSWGLNEVCLLEAVEQLDIILDTVFRNYPTLCSVHIGEDAMHCHFLTHKKSDKIGLDFGDSQRRLRAILGINGMGKNMEFAEEAQELPECMENYYKTMEYLMY